MNTSMDQLCARYADTELELLADFSAAPQTRDEAGPASWPATELPPRRERRSWAAGVIATHRDGSLAREVAADAVWRRQNLSPATPWSGSTLTPRIRTALITTTRQTYVRARRGREQR
jgi:hypothetical protein